MNKRNETEVIQAWQETVQAEVNARPWFAALLLQKGSLLFTRFVYFYERLTAVGQRARRRLAVGLGTAVLALALSQTPAHADNITVTPGAAGINGGDGCSLVEAIINANDDATTHAECAPGNGADIITLAGNSYSYTTTFGPQSALPDITSPITIAGNGATIQRTGGSNFRLMRVDLGDLTLNDVTVTGGNATTSPTTGGGIRNNADSTLTLNNATISGNTAGLGGGIYNIGTLNINQSVITTNTATNGGGIATNTGTMLTINDSTISNNTASNGSDFGVGGGLRLAGGSMTINRTTISGNTAFLRGGGFEVSATGALTLNHSTVSGNDATFGGGVSNYGTMTLNNNTIVGNSATQPVTGAGGIVQLSGTMTLNRNIVAGNSAPVSREINRFGGTLNANNRNVLGHNGLTNAQAFSGFTPGANDRTATSDGSVPTALASILDTTLADNGGPTLTHALVSGSPAVDFIPTSDPACQAGVSTDQRGAVRAGQVVPGDGRGGLACDAGAFEFDSAETPTAVTLQAITATSAGKANGLAAFAASLLTGLGGLWLWMRSRTAVWQTNVSHFGIDEAVQ
ncbi:MAG: hypothetical protein KC415_01065 [Anaerolineales bacterium]|nr:hypothetical protein [Anaerolineales bacterium]MCB8983685.1 hypothetical protein [Ardenticatenaceae bacterium]